MKNPIYIHLILCALLMGSCGRKPSGPATSYPISFENAKVLDIGCYLSSVHFVQLENQPESAFTDINKVVVNGGNIFLLDKKLEAVFCFDTTGKFRYRIQRVGRGPGEYRELEAFWINSEKQELWLQSFWPSMILVFDLDGHLLRYFPIQWSAEDMVGLGNNLLAGFNASGSNNGIDSLPPGIFLLNPDGTSRGPALVTGDTSIYWSMNYQRHLEEFDGGALLLSQSDTLYKIDRHGHVAADMVMDWGRVKYPEGLRNIRFSSPGNRKALTGNYVYGKDQLVAFGPVRLFRIILNGRLQLAMADLSTGKGAYSDHLASSNARVPLLYPIAKSDQNELVGLYDMDLLLAMKESADSRQPDPGSAGLYQVMDSLVKSALAKDRPVLWFAKIKNEWLTKPY